MYLISAFVLLVVQATNVEITAHLFVRRCDQSEFSKGLCDVPNCHFFLSTFHLALSRSLTHMLACAHTKTINCCNSVRAFNVLWKMSHEWIQWLKELTICEWKSAWGHASVNECPLHVYVRVCDYICRFVCEFTHKLCAHLAQTLSVDTIKFSLIITFVLCNCHLNILYNCFVQWTKPWWIWYDLDFEWFSLCVF